MQIVLKLSSLDADAFRQIRNKRVIVVIARKPFEIALNGGYLGFQDRLVILPVVFVQRRVVEIAFNKALFVLEPLNEI